MWESIEKNKVGGWLYLMGFSLFQAISELQPEAQAASTVAQIMALENKSGKYHR